MIEVRLATADEAPLVHRITLESFEDLREILDPPSGALSETLDHVIASIAKGGAPIAFLDGQPAGAARFAILEDHVYCGRVGVLPQHRRKGVAAALLQFIETTAMEQGFDEVRLATRAQLADNLRLYERLGYSITGRSQHPRGPDMVVEFSKNL
jgi:GNAT superfamily N-acetyltransferase